MGLYIVISLLLIGGIVYLFFAKKRSDTAALIFVVGLVLVFIVGFLAGNVFPKYGIPELVDTKFLNDGEQSGSIYIEEEKTKLYDSDVNVKITYELSYNPEESVYIFTDGEDNVYYVTENEVRIKTVKEVLDNDNVNNYPAEIINGNYEKLYVEKYKREAPMTFWSFGGTKYEYKFYIPQSIDN